LGDTEEEHDICLKALKEPNGRESDCFGMFAISALDRLYPVLADRMQVRKTRIVSWLIENKHNLPWRNASVEKSLDV
jgi:hypothetical protein